MPARKSTSNKYCSVPGCYSKTKTGEISLHLFPKDKHLRKQWQTRLRFGKKVTDSMPVCSLHFKKEDFRPIPTYQGE